MDRRREIVRGRRSSLLYDDSERTLHRHYHDTGFITSALPTYLDSNGVERFHNRRVDGLVASHPELLSEPPHLRNTLNVLVRNPTSVAQLAAVLGVRETTGWCYLCKAVERWPQAADLAKTLVYPPLCRALGEVECAGTLKEVMQRLEQSSSLRGDYEWRAVEHRYAHLRLARLCCCTPPVPRHVT